MKKLINTTIDGQGNEYRLYCSVEPVEAPKDYYTLHFESVYTGVKTLDPQTKWRATLPVEALTGIAEVINSSTHTKTKQDEIDEAMKILGFQ